MEYDIDFYKHFSWLRKVNPHSSAISESYVDRLSRLEGDKESLTLQVNVLTDRVEAQGAKINDLQSSLVEYRHKLNSTKEMLQQELLHRTSLENQKRSLMGEVSHLKIKLADMEGKQGHCAERQQKAESLLKELRVLKDKVEHLEDQKFQYEKKLKATKTEISSLQQLLLSKNAEIESLHTQLLARPPLSPESSERDQELQKLRSEIKALVAANDEKDRRIEELTVLLNQCRQFGEVTHATQPAPPAVHSLSNGRTPSTSSEEEEHGLMKNIDSASAKSEDIKSEVSNLSTTSSMTQQTSLSSVQKDSDSGTEPQILSSSTSDLTNQSLQKGGQMVPVSSSPLEKSVTADSSSEITSQKSPDGSEDGDSSQRKLDKVGDSSASNNSPILSEANTQSGQRAVGSPEYMKNNRSFKRLWGKLRRTQSGGLQAADQDAGQFKRGGLRATAGPRLTQTSESYVSARDMNIPFSQWTKEQVCSWIEDYGLGQYVNITRQWIENGQTLLSATSQDLEKELGMKNPLHRKKLQLALTAFTRKVLEKSSELNYLWVTRKRLY